jgi:ABC-type phosphate/phosphonate transport system substrate-binding protein
MNDLKIFAPISFPFTLFFLAVLAMWFVGKNSQAKLDYHLPSLIEDSYTCTAGSNSSAEKLTVYMNTQVVARNLANLLCGDPVVQRQYHQVQAYWGTGDVSDITFIGKGIGDLVNTKDNIVQAFDAENTHGYKRLASYSQYQAYLIGRDEKPILTREYLLGRRIGLLDYPSSRSGHIIPMHLLRELDLREEHVSIVYSHNHTGLRELLASGKVDMIASYWAAEDAERFSENYIQAIGNSDIRGSSWYLKMNGRNTDLFCALQATLGNLAQQQQSTYFGELSFAEGCPQSIVKR